MNMEIRLTSPLLLILIGLGFLLANLGVIPITPWEALVQYWPALLVILGVYHLAKVTIKGITRRRVSVSGLLFAVVLILLGLYILAPRIGWDVSPVSWSIVWPSALIAIGVIKLIQDRFDLFSFSVTSGPSRTSVVGEIRKGGSSWVLDDMRLRHGVGEVHLDLTQAIIPDREVNIDIAGIVGEVAIYIPADLPVQAQCESNIGEITVFDQHRDGLGNEVSYRSPNYDTATQKLNILVQWKIGEIKIRQIG